MATYLFGIEIIAKLFAVVNTTASEAMRHKYFKKLFVQTFHSCSIAYAGKN